MYSRWLSWPKETIKLVSEVLYLLLKPRKVWFTFMDFHYLPCKSRKKTVSSRHVNVTSKSEFMTELQPFSWVVFVPNIVHLIKVCLVKVSWMFTVHFFCCDFGFIHHWTPRFSAPNLKFDCFFFCFFLCQHYMAKEVTVKY